MVKGVGVGDSDKRQNDAVQGPEERSDTLNPQPQTPNPNGNDAVQGPEERSDTLNPKPYTLNPNGNDAG